MSDIPSPPPPEEPAAPEPNPLPEPVPEPILAPELSPLPEPLVPRAAPESKEPSFLHRFWNGLCAFASWLWHGREDRTGIPWIRRTLAVFFGVTVVLPVFLIFLFRFVPPPTTPYHTEVWFERGTIYKQWRPLDQISLNLAYAVIGAEDQKFCSHWGFDLEAIDKALDHNARSRRVRGASTISQQTAKNLFLSQSRNWVRKGIEAYLTLLIEGLWPKRRIIEVYLNIVQFGPNVFGAEEASRMYFHHSAAKLADWEAARLATVLPNPVRYSVNRPGPYVTRQTADTLGDLGAVRAGGLGTCVLK